MLMADVITSVSTVFTAAIGWLGTVADTVTGEPILMIFCVLPLIGTGVGLFKRLLNVN